MSCTVDSCSEADFLSKHLGNEEIDIESNKDAERAMRTIVIQAQGLDANTDAYQTISEFDGDPNNVSAVDAAHALLRHAARHGGIYFDNDSGSIKSMDDIIKHAKKPRFARLLNFEGETMSLIEKYYNSNNDEEKSDIEKKLAKLVRLHNVGSRSSEHKVMLTMLNTWVIEYDKYNNPDKLEHEDLPNLRKLMPAFVVVSWIDKQLSKPNLSKSELLALEYLVPKFINDSGWYGEGKMRGGKKGFRKMLEKHTNQKGHPKSNIPIEYAIDLGSAQALKEAEYWFNEYMRGIPCEHMDGILEDIAMRLNTIHHGRQESDPDLSEEFLRKVDKLIKKIIETHQENVTHNEENPDNVQKVVLPKEVYEALTDGIDVETFVTNLE